MADIVEAGDLQPELPGLCELSKASAKADELVSGDARGLQNDLLTDIVDTVFVETEAIGLVRTIHEVANVGANTSQNTEIKVNLKGKEFRKRKNKERCLVFSEGN